MGSSPTREHFGSATAAFVNTQARHKRKCLRNSTGRAPSCMITHSHIPFRPHSITLGSQADAAAAVHAHAEGRHVDMHTCIEGGTHAHPNTQYITQQSNARAHARTHRGRFGSRGSQAPGSRSPGGEMQQQQPEQRRHPAQQSRLWLPLARSLASGRE
jgi:hypothetical protein